MIYARLPEAADAILINRGEGEREGMESVKLQHASHTGPVMLIREGKGATDPAVDVTAVYFPKFGHFTHRIIWGRCPWC